jgi:hypothetical protein
MLMIDFIKRGGANIECTLTPAEAKKRINRDYPGIYDNVDAQIEAVLNGCECSLFRHYTLRMNNSNDIGGNKESSLNDGLA